MPVKQYSRAIFAVFLMAGLLNGCGAPERDQSSTESSHVSDKKIKDNEGTKALKSHFQTLLSECGDTWTATSTENARVPEIKQFQYTNIEFLVEEQEITAAQKANGITFVGNVSYGPDALIRSRDISSWQLDDEYLSRTHKVSEKFWTPWMPMVEDGNYTPGDQPIFVMWQQNGIWNFEKANLLTTPYFSGRGLGFSRLGNTWRGSVSWAKSSCDLIEKEF